ncbi:2-amino-4-hydroxy-6-hydroxymethyldihydropteridine diphosphokinase [Candidatus Erwinia haradaeae]|uniref:2-amino-4-hydroxy-6-hydroxymethyldihydropteridine pyrophosphokinase n=1 Tax=Candidatus Erwinia haradaeae TaxID=1922217 RepID=A0A451D9X2_9GAMM|nr:2-amino-4-hydroxy-6-hydroxymethyldihydropteridine diphosphokinase [Candidatus Erwinia haradaeae]VFP83000.1 2-amino-4-hydroxy-6-hydroxymethyldihydropteridinepyrophosphokinase [Candidatus Erwinia haradaeae]
MNRVYLSLGSNLSNPLYQICRALEKLASLPKSQVFEIAHLYRTLPYGSVYQADFLNTVVALDTLLLPEELINHTQRMEREQKRSRQSHRWGPRTLDLDIILFGKQTINTPKLIVPHYDMQNRAFMLVPLLDITPLLHLPTGQSLAHILKTLDTSTIQRVTHALFDLTKSKLCLQKHETI